MSTAEAPPAAPGGVVELAHGGGGSLTHRLLEDMLAPLLALPADQIARDGALLDPGGARLAFSTDSFVVQPLVFPGGDIGALAVNGTVNDLAMCGARPLWLSVALVMEEGLPLALLHRILASMGAAARAAGVRIVTGDTKTVERGRGDGLIVNTAGIGALCVTPAPGPDLVRTGDAVLLSGDVGRHGIAVMVAREDLGLEGAFASDSAPLAATVLRLIAAGVGIRCLRDPTRGGLATTLIEIARSARLAIAIDEAAVAVDDAVRGACELLGLDPLYVASEGRFLAIVAPEDAARALAVLRDGPGGHAAAIIGAVRPGPAGMVLCRGTLGTERVLDMLSGEQLPRIC